MTRGTARRRALLASLFISAKSASVQATVHSAARRSGFLQPQRLWPAVYEDEDADADAAAPLLGATSATWSEAGPAQQTEGSIVSGNDPAITGDTSVVKAQEDADEDAAAPLLGATSATWSEAGPAQQTEGSIVSGDDAAITGDTSVVDAQEAAVDVISAWASDIVNQVADESVQRANAARRAHIPAPMPTDRYTASPRAQWEQRAKMFKENATGFVGRPPRHEWGQRLALAIQTGADKGCAAAIPYVANHWGLGSKINNIVNVMWVAVYLGSSIVWRRPDDFGEPWARHFENKLGLATPECSTDPEDWRQYQEFYTTTRSWAVSFAAVDRDYVDDMKHYLTEQVWSLKAETLAEINRRLALLGLQEGTGSYIGVHIRRGDKGEEAPLVPMGDYVDALKKEGTNGDGTFLQVESNMSTMLGLAMRVKKAMSEADLNTVYLASDDASTLQEMRDILGAGVLVLQAAEVPRQDCTFGESGKECHFDEDDSLMSLLTDIEALRRSSVFIGTASSNIGRLVYFLRPAEQESISLDDGNDFLLRGG